MQTDWLWDVLEKDDRILGRKRSGFDIVICDEVEYDDDSDYDLFHDKFKVLEKCLKTRRRFASMVQRPAKKMQ
jgi:hypothetical protein